VIVDAPLLDLLGGEVLEQAAPLAEQHRDDVELDKDAYLRPTTSVVRLRQGVSLTC